MSRMRVLVCGSNYGRAHITAVACEPRKYQLTGILARGSVRSHQVAALHDVPLYRSVDELPRNVDVACAAMSSSAWPVVLQLIGRGIHVLCEHPYPARELQTAFKLARKHNVQFHVNSHFAYLPAPQAFIRDCRRAARVAAPKFVEVFATERSLYGALDILISALPGLQSLQARVRRRRGSFVLLEGSGGETPVWVSVQVSGGRRGARLEDGSAGYLLDQRLTVAFPTGLLTLLSMAGPVVWNSTPAHSRDERPLWRMLNCEPTQALAELREQRIQANVAALNALRQSILRQTTPQTQQRRHILQVSQAWEAIGRRLY